MPVFTENTRQLKLKKNLLFYIGTLKGGGAERVLIELLKNLDRNKYRLFIAVNRPKGAFFDQIPNDVQLIDRSSLYKKKTGLFERYFGMASIIKKEKIDLAMGFLPGANRSLMRSKYFTEGRVKMVLNEQNNPSFVSRFGQSWFREKLEQLEMSLFYPKADGIVVACKGLEEHFLNALTLDTDKVHVIYNMINSEKIERHALEPVPGYKFSDDTKIIVAAGRLTEQKAYGDMLEVFKKAQNQVPAHLIILGEGHNREKIETKVHDLSLSDFVYMPGFMDNPFAYMGRADLYLSTSRWEGFHLTIAEAMACGTVPVVTDCDYGPREIITDGKNGRLLPVGDIEGLNKAIIKILTDDELRTKMAANARIRAKDFDVSKIVGQYEKLIDHLLNGEPV